MLGNTLQENHFRNIGCSVCGLNTFKGKKYLIAVQITSQFGLN